MRRAAIRRPESLTDRYRIIGKIGEGTYGIVFKAEAYASTSAASHGHNSHSSGGGSGSGSGSGSAGHSHVHSHGHNHGSSHGQPPTRSTSNSSSGGSGGGGGNSTNGNPNDGAAGDDEPMMFGIKVVKSHKEGKNDVVLSSATVREIKLLRELHHDNVIHLHDVLVDPRDKTLALVFEYADHDLHDIIVQSKQKPLSEYTKKSLMYQILKGVDYMHDAWCMHRDMKPQNILVVGHGRRRGQVKLGDFGLARLYKEPIKALSDVERVVVTLWYRAPELLLGAKHYTKSVDMWAVGCIFAEMVNARELFCGKEVEGSNAPFQKDQLDKIFKILGLPTPQTWDGMEHLPEYQQVVQMGRERKYPSQSELRNAVKFGTGRNGAALHDLIARMLAFDPEQRITAKDALEHEYFKQIEPEPRDWAFDEPGKEPVAFRTQTIEPVVEDSLPWKMRKDAPSDAGARAAGEGSPSHRSSSQQASQSQSQSQASANGAAPAASSSRSSRSQHHSSSSATTASAAAASNGGAAWRDRNAGSSVTSAAAGATSTSTSGNKRAASDRPGSGSRARSPKQQRRR